MGGPNDPAGPAAVAPYNFVRLPAAFISGETPPDANAYDDKRLTGTLEFSITTKTPLFIGGPGQRDQSKVQVAHRSPIPFATLRPGGDPIIPGSELRGMLSTLFEIATWSHVRFIDDALLFYRKFPRRDAPVDADLGDSYLAEVKDHTTAGWISRQQGGDFEMRPSIKVGARGYFQVALDVPERLGITSQWSADVDVWFQRPGPPPRNGPPARPTALPDPPVTKVQRCVAGKAEPGEGWIRGRILRGGGFGADHGRSMHWVITMPDMTAEAIPLDRKIVEAYRTRIGGFTQLVQEHNFSALPGKMEGHDNDEPRRPAFFIKRADPELIVFGHTAYFRIPYRKRMRAAFPKRDITTADMTEAVFGYVEGPEGAARRGRVKFEHAELAQPLQDECWETQAFVADLYEPRPTSYQLYLEQPDLWQRGAINGKPVHWNDENARLRGTKLWWHRAGAQWQHTQEFDRRRPLLPKTNPIRPLKPGVVFRSRIRFENLTHAELGALLLVLDLKDSLAHKIGYGKPLGLGSIRIDDVALHIDDRDARYRTIFDNAGQFALPQHKTPPRIDELKARFATWLIEGMPEKDKADLPDGDDAIARLWGHPRMVELETMLDFAHAPREGETAYVDYGQFKPNWALRRPVYYKLKQNEELKQNEPETAAAAANGGGQRQQGAAAPTLLDIAPAALRGGDAPPPPPRLRVGQKCDGVATEITNATVTFLVENVVVRVPTREFQGLVQTRPNKGDSVRLRITQLNPDGTAIGKRI